jgi:hypothetical protein
MDDIIRIFGRLIKISFGFLAACFCASLLLVVTAHGWAVEFSSMSGWEGGGTYQGIDNGPIGVFAALFFATFTTSFVGATALVPAGLAIVLAETQRLTALTYHLIAGGLVSTAIVVATWIPPEHGMRLPQDWNLFLAAGFVGGFVYWVIAGRTSGAWRHKR